MFCFGAGQARPMGESRSLNTGSSGRVGVRKAVNIGRRRHSQNPTRRPLGIVKSYRHDFSPFTDSAKLLIPHKLVCKHTSYNASKCHRGLQYGMLEEVAKLRQTVGAQRDETARLKGGSGRPNIKPSGMDSATEPKPAQVTVPRLLALLRGFGKAALGDIEEPAPRMRPTEGQPDRFAAALPVIAL
jgi:hypothetical protein